MDIDQAAFGLNVQSASRVYFINPQLKPQVEAQAIARAVRIGSTSRRVAVETLVLRGSIEELIIERKRTMTLAEQRKVRSILDDKPIFEWIKTAKIMPLGEEVSTERQMAPLERPLGLFRRGFGETAVGDDDLVPVDEKFSVEENLLASSKVDAVQARSGHSHTKPETKRKIGVRIVEDDVRSNGHMVPGEIIAGEGPPRKIRKGGVRFTDEPSPSSDGYRESMSDGVSASPSPTPSLPPKKRNNGVKFGDELTTLTNLYDSAASIHRSSEAGPRNLTPRLVAARFSPQPPSTNRLVVNGMPSLLPRPASPYRTILPQPPPPSSILPPGHGTGTGTGWRPLVPKPGR
jgi:hypothetical protein